MKTNMDMIFNIIFFIGFFIISITCIFRKNQILKHFKDKKKMDFWTKR
jgi:hypothetical protein